MSDNPALPFNPNPDDSSASAPLGTPTTPLGGPVVQESTVIPPVPPTPTSGGKKFPIAAIFGILLLIGGIGAGLLLVGQSQIFREKASGTCTQNTNDGTTIHLCQGTYSISVWTCPNAKDPVSGQCFCSSGHGTATTSTIIVSDPNGQNFNAPSVQCGSSQWDVNSGGGAGIDGGGVCFSSGTDCGGGGGGGPTPTPAPTATPRPICGDQCSVDSDCSPSSGGNVHPVCDPTTKTCQNPNCLGYTTPGTICSCGPAPTALECGALCGGQNDGSVYPINCSNGVCGNNANGGTTGNRCLPWSPTNGDVTKGGICKQDPNPAVYCMNHADGTPVLTVSDILAACGPVATPTPTPAPIACFNITASIPSPQIGQTVSFTCGAVTGATRYEFQYRIDNGATVNLAPSSATSNISQSFTVAQGGGYEVQCRPCDANGCGAWEQNWGPTPTPNAIGANVVGLWHFDESTGTGAYLLDSSGKGNNGTPTGTTLLASGLNGSRSFNGTSDFVNIAGVPVNTTAGSSNTVEFWMKWTGQVLNNGIMVPFGFSGNYDLSFSGASCFGFNTVSGDVLGTTTAMPANQWVHVAAVFPNGVPSTTTAKLYINGTLKTLSYCLGSSSVSRTASGSFRVGSFFGYAFFPGAIDELTISNTALSASQVLADYQYGINSH